MLNIILNSLRALPLLRFMSYLSLCPTNQISILCCLPVFHPRVVKYGNWVLLNYDFVTNVLFNFGSTRLRFNFIQLDIFSCSQFLISSLCFTLSVFVEPFNCLLIAVPVQQIFRYHRNQCSYENMCVRAY
jgi:hypothetical protein